MRHCIFKRQLFMKYELEIPVTLMGVNKEGHLNFSLLLLHLYLQKTDNGSGISNLQHILKSSSMFWSALWEPHFSLE